jgi:hypothetical protein
MIRVTPAPEPPDFDTRVRRPGLDAIAELVGEQPSRTRRGPRRVRVAIRREDIPAKASPDFWCDVLDDLCEAYQYRCAYLGVRVHPGTGNRTIDHFVHKARAWDLVYEWSNYRLCAGLVNAKKGTSELPYDPFTLPDDLVALELVTLRVVPGPAAAGAAREVVETMLNETLGLNERPFRKLREGYVNDYLTGGMPLWVLERDAPFVAYELRRQGRLLQADT